MSNSRPVTTPSSMAVPATLPEHLARWGAERRHAIALRHKTHGVWKAWTWGQLQAEVARVAAALAARGFERGDVVAIASDLSPRALAVVLGAQGLGGAALWIEPEAGASPEPGGPAAAATAPAARFGLARDEAALIALRAQLGADPWALGLFTAEHEAPHREKDHDDEEDDGDAKSAVRGYAADFDVGAAPPSAPLGADPSDPAFFFPPGRAAGVERRAAAALTQAAAIARARAWLEADAIGAGTAAFVWEGPTTAAAAIILAGWLVAGFTLTVPEDATTADADRREVQPTMMAATRSAYQRLWQQVSDNLPASGSFLRRAVDMGLACPQGGARGALAWWLVRRPLREVLGLRRVEVALVLDPALSGADEWLARIGVQVRALPLSPTADTVQAHVSPSQAAQSSLFEPALVVLSSSRPGELA